MQSQGKAVDSGREKVMGCNPMLLVRLDGKAELFDAKERIHKEDDVQIRD